MQTSQLPVKVSTVFAEAAGGAFIRQVPIPSQIGIQAGAASFQTGFPPACFTPTTAGGTPPWGQDVNGLLFQMSGWDRWFAAGGPVTYDSAFQALISGYPAGAVVYSATTFGRRWRSDVENNVTNPDTGGAGWTNLGLLPGPAASTVVGEWPNLTLAPSGAAPGTYVRPTLTVAADGRVSAVANGAQPTYQKFVSGSGTATASLGVKRWKVRMCGGGGSGGLNAAAGGAGAATVLGAWTANPGQGGGANNGTAGAGGAGGADGVGTLIVRFNGGSGQDGSINAIGSGSITFVSNGGANPFGGNGRTVAPNTGAGGTGSSSVSTGVRSAAGGGAGEYVEFVVANPTSLSYTVGAGGTPGGDDGAAGIILIEELYD